MKKIDLTECDPLVVDASMDEDELNLGLTAEGYQTLKDGLDHLRETNPNATLKEAFMMGVRSLIKELEAGINN